MRFEAPLLFGRLIRRYKRFLADIELDDGRGVTVHCANTGSLKSCCEPGWRVALSTSASPTRKHAHTWELVHNGVDWIGINTILANCLAEEAIREGIVPELGGYDTIQRERRYGVNSRIDLLLERDPLSRQPRLESPANDTADGSCYVEVKNVSFLAADGSVAFPDAVTKRGRKHLGELEGMVRDGHRSVMLFVVQRVDGTHFRPAWAIDPAYGHALVHAVEHGVEALAYQADVSPEGIALRLRLPIDLTVPPGLRG